MFDYLEQFSMPSDVADGFVKTRFERFDLNRSGFRRLIGRSERAIVALDSRDAARRFELGVSFLSSRLWKLGDLGNA